MTEMRSFLVTGLLALLFACPPPARDQEQAAAPSPADTLATDIVTEIPDEAIPLPEKQEFLPDTSELERTIIRQGLVNILSIDPEIQIDVKYSTEDNFMGEDLYGDYASCYLQPVVAKMLAQAQQHVRENHPDLNLLIFDCVRPRSVQYKMWDLVKGTAKQEYVAPPRAGSMHNYGAAIDLGLVHHVSGLVDMGTAYDFCGLVAQPRHEMDFLKKGQLNQQQIDNGRILRAAMRKAGFRGILSEWWHFDAFDSDEVRRRFKLVE